MSATDDVPVDKDGAAIPFRRGLLLKHYLLVEVALMYDPGMQLRQLW